MHKFTHPQTGSVLLVPRAKEAADVAAFLNRHPRVLPPAPTEPPVLSGGVVALACRLLLLILLALLIAAAFFFAGEERPGSVVRPALTARQRAAAFR